MKALRISLLCAALLAVPAMAADNFMPPNIQAIMNKAKNGQAPTDAEMKAVQAWTQGAMKNMGAATGGSGVSSTMDNESTAAEDEDGAKNLCKTGGHAGFGAAPSQGAYVAMAKDATKIYSAKMPDGGLFLLKRQLDNATNPTWGADASLLMLTKSSGSAAVIAAASSAQRVPKDALTASNLGVALRGMKDYARAAIALTYAKSLSPDSTVIATNLGWLAMSQHDTATAGKFFNAALSENKDMSAALSGDGLIAQCTGKHTQALKFFRTSLKNGYSRLADVGVQSAENDILKNNPGADIGSPADVGGAATPVSAPGWPDPPIAKDAREMAQWGLAAQNSGPAKWYQQWEDSVSAQNDTIKSIGINADALPSKSVQGGKTVFRRGFEKEVQRVSDIKRMTFGPIEKAGEQITQDVNDMRMAVGDGGECKDTRAKIEALYPHYAGTLRGDWGQLRAAIGRHYQAVAPAIADITDDNVRKQGQAVLNDEVLGGLTIYGAQLRMAMGAVVAMYQPDDRVCGQLPAIVVKPGTLKNYPIDPNACKSGETHMNFGVINFNADCEKMTLDFGEALVGSGEYKFGNDWGSDQITIFAGVGASGGLGPLSAGAKTGAYMTFQGGQVMDYGSSSSASISVGSGPVSVGAEASARLSAVSGVDVALNSGVTIAAPSAE
jgi:tetratricopeptide (TPR) repeat protein